MPPTADYWKHFKVVGVVAYCLVAECQQPNISLGALPKPGEKKRLRKQISYEFFYKISYKFSKHFCHLYVFLLGTCKLEWK